VEYTAQPTTQFDNSNDGADAHPTVQTSARPNSRPFLRCSVPAGHYGVRALTMSVTE